MLIKFMWVILDSIINTVVFFIFILCYLDPLQIVAQLWRDLDIFYKVAQHHSPCFSVQSEALGTIKFTLFVWELDPQQFPR